MSFQKLGIIGAGTTGGILCRIVAQRGFPVTLVDSSRSNLEHAVEKIRGSLDELVAKKVVPDKDSVLSRIQLGLDLKALAESWLIVETITDDEKLKTELFADLGKTMPSQALFSTNAALSSITKLASVSGRPDRFLGLHFVPPVSESTYVEIVPGLATFADTLMRIRNFIDELGFRFVISQDAPGFLHNRFFLLALNEAAHMLAQGIADPEAIDHSFKWGFEAEQGPLALADQLGLDRVLHALQVLHQQREDAISKPSALLVKYVEAGFLGKKTGRGFFEYRKETL